MYQSFRGSPLPAKVLLTGIDHDASGWRPFKTKLLTKIVRVTRFLREVDTSQCQRHDVLANRIPIFQEDDLYSVSALQINNARQIEIRDNLLTTSSNLHVASDLDVRVDQQRSVPGLQAPPVTLELTARDPRITHVWIPTVIAVELFGRRVKSVEIDTVGFEDFDDFGPGDIAIRDDDGRRPEMRLYPIESGVESAIEQPNVRPKLREVGLRRVLRQVWLRRDVGLLSVSRQVRLSPSVDLPTQSCDLSLQRSAGATAGLLLQLLDACFEFLDPLMTEIKLELFRGARCNLLLGERTIRMPPSGVTDELRALRRRGRLLLRDRCGAPRRGSIRKLSRVAARRTPLRHRTPLNCPEDRQNHQQTQNSVPHGKPSVTRKQKRTKLTRNN